VEGLDVAEPAEADDVRGERLRRAVESILASDEAIKAAAKGFEGAVGATSTGLESRRRAAVKAAIERYSDLAALSGGASALPALVPGIGTVAAIAGGALADVTLLLKWELELGLVLAVLHGRDIHDPAERTAVFVLAASGTAEARGVGNVVADGVVTGGLALWNYAPRQAGKLLATLLGKLALAAASRSLVRAVPVVGILVGAGANKILTARVGERIDTALRSRAPAQRDDDDVVAARVRPEDHLP